MADEPTAEAEVVTESDPSEEVAGNTVEPEESSPEDAPVEGESAAVAEDPNAAEEASLAEGDAQPTPDPEPLDLSGLTVTQLRELAPELAQQVEYAGAQSKEAELRRIQGSKEATATRLKQIREQLAAMPESVTDEELNFLDVNNRANAEHRHLGAFAQEWAKAWEPTAEERDVINAAAASGDINTYAMTVLHTGARHIGYREVFDMDISEIPADSKLARSVEARDSRRVEVDRKADALEEKTSSATPRPSSAAGQTVNPTSNEDADLQRLQERGIPLTDQKTRQRLAAQLGVKLPT